MARASHEQLLHRTRPHGGVGAPFLDGRPDDDRAVAPGHEVDRAPVHQAAHRARQQRDGRARVRWAEPEDVALDGAQRGEPGGGHAVDGRQARPGRQDDTVRGEAAAVVQDQRGAASERGHPALDERHPAVAAGLAQRAQEGAVVDLVVARDLETAPQGRAQRRDQAPALAGAAAVRLEAERVLVGEEVVEAGPVRCIEGDRDRARRVVAEGETGGGLERGGEGGPVSGTLHQQRRQGRFAEVRLGDGGEHAGRHPGRTVASGGRRDDRHFMTVA